MKTFVSIKSVLLAGLATCVTATASAATYETRVVFSGLTKPTGIVAADSRTLYITQLPTPGVPGKLGGSNTVDRINIASKQLKNIATGEPEPTNLALSKRGELYWTCKSAGVILERSRKGEINLFLGGLTKPSGIAVDRWGHVYFTQLPTPGVPGPMGGSNTVSVTDGETIWPLALGEPEPTDIAVDRHGNAYWTCKTAGVILMRNCDGEISLVLKDLKKPTGIAIDARGDSLYFTEVPTPGVGGSQGGENRVSVLHLACMQVETIHTGDPQPTDITVAPNGRVFWTCTSAGVIVEAREKTLDIWD